MTIQESHPGADYTSEASIEKATKQRSWFNRDSRHKIGIVAAAATLLAGSGLITHNIISHEAGGAAQVNIELCIEEGVEALGGVALALYLKNRGYIGHNALGLPLQSQSPDIQ